MVARSQQEQGEGQPRQRQPKQITVQTVRLAGGTTVHYEFPLSLPLLFFRTPGITGKESGTAGQITGVVKLVVSEKSGKAIKVDVANCNAPKSGSKCRVELIEKGDAMGIDIYGGIGGSHSWLSLAKPKPHIIVTIELPASDNSDAPVLTTDIKADLPFYSFEIGDLSEKVKFRSLKLSGANGSITAQSVNVERGIFKTSNAQILGVFKADEDLRLLTSNAEVKGSFNAKQTVHIDTSNGHIDAHIRLFNDHTRPPAKAELSTTAGKITGSFVLDAPMNNGGSFKVDASTANGAIDVSFSSVPSASTLDFECATTNQPASIALHRQYHGMFLVSTSNSAATIESPAKSGTNQDRNIRIHQTTPNTVDGEVRLLEKEKDSVQLPGRVHVSTTNAVATLKFT